MNKLLKEKKSHFILLTTVWFVMQFLLLKNFGIVTGFEAAKYVEQARSLLANASYSSNNFLFYSTEILLIATSIKLNIGFWLVAIIQIAFNAFSTLLFYKLVFKFCQKSIIAFIATLLMVTMFYYQLYNVHLFTESLFFSFSIIFCYYLFTIQNLSFRNFSLILIGLIILCLTRPIGILFFPATLFFLIYRFGKRKILLSFICIVAGCTLFYFILNQALDSGGEFDFLLPYIEEHVICGVPTFQGRNTLDTLPNKNSVEGLWHVIINNYSLFFRLALKRFVAFWGVQRSFYSFKHNIYISIYFYSLYIFIFLGFKRMFQTFLPETIFLLTYISLTMLTVLLSCDEWHNRFIYAILPFFFLLAIGRWSLKTDSRQNTQ